MRTRRPQMYVLMPFKKELDAAYSVFAEVAQTLRYSCLRSDLDPRTGILEKIIHGIHAADLIIADLTDSNRNVFYELGVANALSKECVMVSQDSLETLPFDVHGYTVIRYTNDPEGLKLLKDNLLAVISSSERIKSPVNTALDAMFKRNRTLSYLLAGAAGGFFLSFPPSLITALIGSSFFTYWQGPGNFWRTVFEGAPSSFFLGGLSLATYSFVHNLTDLRPPNRLVVTVAETLMGLLVGVITFLLVFLLDFQVLGTEVALGTSSPFLILFTAWGLAMGLSLNVQAPRELAEPLATHLMRSILIFLATIGLAVGVIWLFRHRIFFPAYLEHFNLLDAVSDGLRTALWGIEMSAFQWWLRWERRL